MASKPSTPDPIAPLPVSFKEIKAQAAQMNSAMQGLTDNLTQQSTIQQDSLNQLLEQQRTFQDSFTGQLTQQRDIFAELQAEQEAMLQFNLARERRAQAEAAQAQEGLFRLDTQNRQRQQARRAASRTPKNISLFSLNG